MNIAIRADASLEIGTGHIMRCLVLAKELKKRNVHITFLCRTFPGHLVELIKNNGFSVVTLPKPKQLKTKWTDMDWMRENWEKDAKQTENILKELPTMDWLIVDHYGVDRRWENKLRPLVNQLMVIDDLADRSHHCDLLLDQNLYRNKESRYEKLVPKDTIVLTGPKYLLLRQEFRNLQLKRERTGEINRILISFGGSDETNETMKVMKAIQMINRPEVVVDVVIGYSNPNYSKLKKYCEHLPNVHLHYQTNSIAQFMNLADLAIGAGGSTTWERCYVGLPTITIETAPNQTEILNYLSHIGIIRHLGRNIEVTEGDIVASLENLLNHPSKVREMSKKSKSVVKDYQEDAIINQLLHGGYDG